MISTMTDRHCQLWHKKLPSSPCDFRPCPCYPSPPSGTLIAAYQVVCEGVCLVLLLLFLLRLRLWTWCVAWIFRFPILKLTNRRPFSVSKKKKRGTRATVEYEQRNKAKTSMERPPVKAVPECVRNRAPPPPEVTQLQERPTWHDPPSDPPPEVGGTPRSDHTFHRTKESDREFDANHSWNPRERVIIRGMEDFYERSGGSSGVGYLLAWQVSSMSW